MLLANDTTVHVFDADNQSYHAVISNAPAPTSRIAHLAFVSPDEVLVYADFGLKVTLWDLRTGVGLEIRDPKIIIRPGSGYDIRHKTGHLAVLAKQGAKDVVLVFSPAKRELEATWTVDTVDARGLRWSLDGLWVAIWDSSAMGPSIFIYTADGQLFRRWNGTQQHGDEDVGVGVERCEWDENGGLWVALGDERVLNLGGKTVGTIIP